MAVVTVTDDGENLIITPSEDTLAIEISEVKTIILLANGLIAVAIAIAIGTSVRMGVADIGGISTWVIACMLANFSGYCAIKATRMWHLDHGQISIDKATLTLSSESLSPFSAKPQVTYVRIYLRQQRIGTYYQARLALGLKSTYEFVVMDDSAYASPSEQISTGWEKIGVERCNGYQYGWSRYREQKISDGSAAAEMIDVAKDIAQRLGVPGPKVSR